jgi:hypothetical protein
MPFEERRTIAYSLIVILLSDELTVELWTMFLSMRFLLGREIKNSH